MSRSQWYWLSNVFIVLLGWLLLGGQPLKAQQHGDVLLKLKSHRNVMVCGEENDKRVQVSLSIGQVNYSDSLYSFDFIIGYDTNKVRISNALTVNTLAEYFEYKGLGFVEPGYFRLYAAQMLGKPVSGNKALIAFEAKYKGDCSDTVEFFIDYAEVEVSQNLLSRLKYDSAFIKIPVTVKETPNSFVVVTFLQDTVDQYGEDSLARVVLNLNTNNLDNVDYLKMILDVPLNDNLVFDNIQYLNDKIDFVNTYSENDDDKVRLVIEMILKDDVINESIVELNFKRLLNRDDEIVVRAKLDSINECSCATFLKGDSFVLKSLKDTIISVDYRFENDDNEIDFLIVSDELNLGDSDLIEGIEIYNLNGNMVFNSEIKENLIDVSNFARGVYYLQIFKGGKILKKIVMIKN